MVKLSPQDVLKLARLARLRLSEDEILQFGNELNAILNYVTVLDGVDTKDLQPTYQVTGLSDRTRKDEVIDYGVSTEDLLRNVPQQKLGHIKVKRMIS